MMQTHWVGEVLDLSPIGSCQELSEDRIQTLGQERPGQPAVTSLTLAETIHLAEGGPPRDKGVRGTCRSPGYTEAGAREWTCFVCAQTHEDRIYPRKWNTCAPLRAYNTTCQGYFESSPAQSAALST